MYPVIYDYTENVWKLNGSIYIGLYKIKSEVDPAIHDIQKYCVGLVDLQKICGNEEDPATYDITENPRQKH